MKRNLKTLIQQMTLEEKASLCSGLDFWHLKGIERLGIPSIMVSDGPHGLRKQQHGADHLGLNESIPSVCFPPACLSACSFDRTLIQELGDVLGTEAQAEDISVILGPAVNIKRSPLCGRNFEYYSEDPYLAGEMAASFIQGVEAHNVGTSIKHFAANNQEYNRMSSSSEVDERTLREIYFPAFETAIKKSRPATVMCSYNQINGIFSSENPWLLTDILRKEWGFEGCVVSDWGAVNDRVEGLKAGLDLEMPSSGGITDALIVQAVEAGDLDEALLNETVERLLSLIFRWTDHREAQEVSLASDHAFALRIAEESMVLLKNEDVLPLHPQEKIVFIGGFARTPRFQGGGSSHINAFSPVSALTAASATKDIRFEEGFPTDSDTYDSTLAASAIEAARNSNKVVIFAGLPDSFESEGYDRTHMRLPECQNRLIREILAVQQNTIVVLHNGSPVEMPWCKEVKGILEAYLGGEACGEAVVNILFGKVNPSGKLAETFPIKLSDTPSHLCFGDGNKTFYDERCFVGYRYYDTKEYDVAFPFGHGLSYTTFQYSNLQIENKNMSDEDTLTLSVDITNTGQYAGKEVVQIYIRDLTNSIRRPDKELKGFEKVTLAPGETKTITFQLDYRSFSWFNTVIHGWYATSGNYEILIGSSSRDIRLSGIVYFKNHILPPLSLSLNTTVEELCNDTRTESFGMELYHCIAPFFDIEFKNGQAKGDETAMSFVLATPIRNVIPYKLYTKEQLLTKIEELNSLSK